MPRPSPTESATLYEIGTYKIGNDGKMYTIAISSTGVHRWVLAHHQGNKEVEIYSSKHPKHVSSPHQALSSIFQAGERVINTRITNGIGLEHHGTEFIVKRVSTINPCYYECTSLRTGKTFSIPQNHLKHVDSFNYKFSIGERVKICYYGSGVGTEDLGKIVTIIERGLYGGTNGYRIAEPIGNSHPQHGGFNFFIGEKTFEKIEQVPVVFDKQKIKNKISKLTEMAKTTKTITKKAAQEVRKIDTSLINKEEVFKMLALAEATGLPLLLVGDPGVNSN